MVWCTGLDGKFRKLRSILFLCVLHSKYPFTSTDTCNVLEINSIECDSWDNSGHPGMSYILDMTTKVPCPKVLRSPGNTRDIPGCPTRHDYQSPMSKSPKKSWDNSRHPGMSYIPDMTTKVPGPKVQRSPGTTWDIPGCPTRS